MKWIGERISFVDDKERTTIVIYPERIGWINSLMGAWVAMWWTIGLTVIWAFFKLELTDQETIAIFVFLTFWAYYAFRVTRSYLWLIWGKELIKIDEVSLIYKRSIKSYGKAVHYYLENISQLRLYHPKERSLQSAWEASPWIRGGERIEFDYHQKLVKFGRKLNENDSKLLFKFITKKLDDRLRKLK